MKKLKLNLDDIKVESFETIQRKPEKGTIIGQATGTNNCLTCGYTYCDDVSCYQTECNCPTGYTCDNYNTCGPVASCDLTCPTEINCPTLTCYCTAKTACTCP